MIDSITLENWKTHKNSTLKFRKGTNVLVGVIGSGKSSVTDALCYGLFGTFPALQNRRVSTTDLLMRKPVSADMAKVEVCFRIGDKKYRVERVVKRSGTNEGRLYINDTLLAGPKPSQVTERVEHELQVTYELFSRAVYSEQNQVDYFLKLNPADRKKKFDELLDLQKYEVVRSNVNQVVNQFRKNQEADKHVLTQLESAMQHMDVLALREQVALLRVKKSDLEKKIHVCNEEWQKIVPQKKELELKLSDWEKTKQHIHGIQSKKDVLSNQWSHFATTHSALANLSIPELDAEKSSLVSKIKEFVARQEQHRLLELQVQKSMQRKESAEKRMTDWKHAFGNLSIAQVNTNLVQVVSQRNDLKQKLSVCVSRIQENVSAQKVLDAQLTSISTDEKSLAALHATCLTCKQEINPAHKGKLLHDLKEKRSVLNVQTQELQTHYHVLLTEKNGCETILPTLEKEETRLHVLVSKSLEFDSLQREIDLCSRDVAQANESLSRYGQLPSTESVEEFRARLTTIEKALEMTRLREEIPSLDAQLVELTQRAHNLSSSREAYDALLVHSTQIESEKNSLSRELIQLSSQEKDLLLRVESAEKLFAQYEDARSRVSRSSEVEQTLSVFSNALVVTQQQLREGVIRAINAALQELWPSVYPYEDFTLAKVLIQDNDYLLSVREKSGEWIPAESSLSGGERSAAALALRMAIAFVLTRQLSWIILDEPTHNLDAKSVHALTVMLKDRLPALVDQVFVITHASEIEKAATGSLYVLQREKNEDGITIPLNKEMDAGTKVE